MICGAAENNQEIMYISAATLIIVPRTLLAHWEQQIKQHVSARIKYTIYDPYSDFQVCDLSSKDLAWDYDIVLTTFQALSRDHQKRNQTNRGKQASPLLNVHWFRIILDEGHTLGCSVVATGKLEMACQLKAERRWVMTGTPAPNVSASDVVHLQPLLAFLKHEPYGQGGLGVFNRAIVKPFSQRSPQARSILLKVLQQTMIRTSKDQLQRELPSLNVDVVKIDFENKHKLSYQQLAGLIRLNLLLGDWKDPDHNESLLNPRNAKHASVLHKNVLLSCNLAGNLDVNPTRQDLAETLQLLCQRHQVPMVQNNTNEILEVGHPLKRIERGLRDGGKCDRCNLWHRMMCATPCAHLLCTSCVELSQTYCSHCKQKYKMQETDDPERKKHNSHPKWPVPVELIEWQPAIVQKGAIGASGGEWQPTWETTESSKIAYLINRLQQLGNTSKSIVFSKFWAHLRLIRAKLEESGIMFASFIKGNKDTRQALDQFRLCQFVNVLLLDESGSVGLDLSFVNRVFLMEPLVDLSLEHQIISRAHRMGQKREVFVEIIVMKGTVEEVMADLRQKAESEGAQAGTEFLLDDQQVEQAKSQRERFQQQQLQLRNFIFKSLLEL
eukprot:TRINITY_DN7848_c0_g1_i2.p1 TRINITY_DN7848_c0_g1~~TRINITY_DN7848_c0_g1_i2.p1  ORF type:complete len:611 (-),score=61.69 TRINITY_DN7848_c0_g1_i2:538-2370(-)